MRTKLLLLIFMMTSAILWSQTSSFWQNTSRINSVSKENHRSLKEFQTVDLNLNDLKLALNGVAQRNQFSITSNTIISFPNSEGNLERFSIKEASVMHPDLQERFPEIRSYVGQGLDDLSSVIRFSISPKGFNGMILSSKGNTFIEPMSRQGNTYVVFNRESRINVNDDFECSVVAQVRQTLDSQSSVAYRNADDSILRDYRLAVSATGEYTDYHDSNGDGQGTVADALAAINTTMTRVNGIFEVDFSVTMTLIANTDDVIYTNPATDPYGNTTANYNSELQSELTTEIGEANYDIGHLFANLQNNGNAGCIGCVCVNNQKGSGWTSAVVPEGDFFDVDYVAHEIGHQFGANHTWTHGGNEGTNVQVEPGSGSTIMSYAGITGATDVQANVTPNFHAASIEQVTDYIKTTSCQVDTNTMNAVPVVDAGLDYTVPRGTAFILDGSATDADTPSGALTYSWEQMDENNASTTYPSATATTGVAFRAYEPTSNTFRYFPRLETIKTGATSWQWEAMPTVGRTLNFRLTVRDNVAGGGTNNSDDTVITVNGTAGPFVVNSPNTNLTWNAGTTQTITWDVAGTTGNGVNAANVDIFLSTDGGDTYPITLATGVTNDGSHNIVVPNNQGSQNRIMVRGSNHIFFDISNTNFTIGAPIPCNLVIPTSLAASNISFDSATIDWDANVGATFDIRYREVGMIPYTEINDITINTYLLNGLTPLTDYELEIRSVCTPTTSAYSSTLLFSTIAIPPCTGAFINTFPYTETFDSGIGDWTQASGDDGDWLSNNGTTPTGAGAGGNTGPSDDITGGGNYFYLESSTNGTPGEIGDNATAIFESPCFDLSTASSPFVSFYHHMYGANMGSLTFEITNDDGSNWTTLFSLSGDLGNQWNFEQIDLLGYSNQTVRFRFVGVTGNGFRSDMAVDQFMIGPQVLNYCNSNGNDTSDEYISNVTLNSVSTDSPGQPTGGYTDFTSVSIDLDIDNTYQISITPTWPGPQYDDGYSVWIDFNQDGDFTDAGEQVFTQSPTQTTPVIGNISIPNDALFGPTRMRVSLKFNDIPDPCEVFTYGEVEDYTVNIGFDGLLYTNSSWTPNAPDNSTGAVNAYIADGTCVLASDIELNDITIRTGAEAVVDPTGSMTINGNVVSDGTLTLNSISDNYSSLIVDGTVVGNVRYLRHVNNTATVGQEDANDLIAPPLSGQTFNDFILNNNNIVNNGTQYLFGPLEKVTNTYALYSNTETAPLDAGTGYRTASTDDSTFEFTGTVNTGNINVPIVVSGPTYPEWNLVGNPYPSYISLADFLAANNTQLAAPNVAIYGYDGNASNGWTIWNQAYSDLNPNAKITPGQGFLVASVSGGGTISFTSSMREAGNSDDFIANRNESSSNNISYFKLNLTNGTDNYYTEFYVSDNASLGLDPGYDARTYGSIAPEFSIYSHLVQGSDGTDMAVQGISDLDISNNVIIPLGVNVTSGQQLTISLSDNMLPDTIDIYLEDRQNNTFTLLNDTDFVLNSISNLQGIGRFYLRFSQGTLNINDSNLETIELVSLADPRRIVVNGLLIESTEFSLYDIRGREVLKKNLEEGSSINIISASELVSGVYLAQLKNFNNRITKKLILR